MNWQEVYSFWFEECDSKQWFQKDEDFNKLIRDRFLDTWEAARNCELSNWRSSAKGRLAEIIVLDQFSRNLWVGSAKSFSQDSLALALAQEMVSQGLDYFDEFNNEQRLFLYLPFMHSESLKVHDQAILLFEKAEMKNELDYEHKHRDILAKFGRYPHRNQWLGRESTIEELQFLEQPGSSF